MAYLFQGQLPAQEEEVDRILTLAEDYRAHGNELQRRLPQIPGLEGQWRYATVPPVGERLKIT
jgi:hypothetical protein